jgi:hypothetical protein
MLTNFLVGLAWLVIVLLPAVVAFRQPVVSHNGYLDDYLNASGETGPAAGAAGNADAKL